MEWPETLEWSILYLYSAKVKVITKNYGIEWFNILAYNIIDESTWETIKKEISKLPLDNLKLYLKTKLLAQGWKIWDEKFNELIQKLKERGLL